VAVPAGILLARSIFPRAKILGALLRWSPFVVGAVRGLRAAAAPVRNR
jgi:hypothetical protein